MKDGIVLVDQERCRGWRFCVSGCPYKKVYFNQGRQSRECTFCYHALRLASPPCAETCVGRLRYIGLVLYDADRVTEAASMPNDQDLYEAQKELILDPFDPVVMEHAEAGGIYDWIMGAQHSPITNSSKNMK